MARTRTPRTTVDKLVTAALAVGATARVTRLITTDKFPGQHIRDHLLTKLGPDAFATQAAECPWCTAVWVAAPATVSALLWGHTRWWRALAAWMALSMTASIVVVNTDPA